MVERLPLEILQQRAGTVLAAEKDHHLLLLWMSIAEYLKDAARYHKLRGMLLAEGEHQCPETPIETNEQMDKWLDSQP